MNCVHFLSMFESLWPFWAGIIRNTRYGGWRSLFSLLLVRPHLTSWIMRRMCLSQYEMVCSLSPKMFAWNLQKKRVAFIFQCRCRINPCHLLCSHQDTFIRKLSIRRTLNESVSSKQKDRPHRMAWGRYWNMAQTKIVDKTFHFDFQL